MIDIHSHILPNLDDGASSLEDALSMAKQAEEQGIYLMVATPHHQNGRYTNQKTDIEQEVKRFNTFLNEQGVNLNVAPGQEVRLYGDIIQDYEQQHILTLNQSSYLLVELPSDHVPAYTSRILYDLQLAGVQPIIAHPERNREIIQHPDKLYELVKQGALAQLTASSITGRFGKAIKKFSEQLIEHQLVHIIASDTHNTTTRPNDLRAAFGTIEKTFDINTVYYYQENAETLVYGETVFAEPPTQMKKKKFLGIF
ncbi:tyrosine-protein phosphatase [Halalkalibacter urbisdiaboli]|uniref:tyrosine-protein phosphatase n=2 Tax=Halalkalibacter urbisdiaboli TaxID=1960589 RepID=UPI000B446886|nr:CpsB/CapC family capsule biosynthesis tyrosine phosphatase [Halalkalibacter urbisdiaboli]